MNYLYLTKLLLTFQIELIYQLQNHENLLRLIAQKGLYCKLFDTNLHITTYGKLKSKQGNMTPGLRTPKPLYKKLYRQLSNPPSNENFCPLVMGSVQAGLLVLH